jgi:hypothetical protein
VVSADLKSRVLNLVEEMEVIEWKDDKREESKKEK